MPTDNKKRLTKYDKWLATQTDKSNSCLFCGHYGCKMLQAWREIVGNKADTTFTCSEFVNTFRAEPRPYRAGAKVAEALCETAHILYLKDNRKQYLNGLKDRIEKELSNIQELDNNAKISNT